MLHGLGPNGVVNRQIRGRKARCVSSDEIDPVPGRQGRLGGLVVAPAEHRCPTRADGAEDGSFELVAAFIRKGHVTQVSGPGERASTNRIVPHRPVHDAL